MCDSFLFPCFSRGICVSELDSGELGVEIVHRALVELLCQPLAWG